LAEYSAFSLLECAYEIAS